MSDHWRVGRSVGRTIYLNDELVGLMDTPELAAQVVAALAARPQPLFEAVVKTTMPSSLHMDGTSPVTLAAWADTETLRQVEGQRIVAYPAVAGSATPEEQRTRAFVEYHDEQDSAEAGSVTPIQPVATFYWPGYRIRVDRWLPADVPDDDAVAGSATPTRDES